MALDRDELAARATAARAALLALCDALRPEAVAPAASPAPYVPKCGDVVRHINDAPGTDDRIVTESLCDGAFRMLSLRYSNLSSSGYNVAAFWRFVRPATAAERAAAGLPVDESAVDRAHFDSLIDAVLWVLNDAAFKAPEQIGEVADRWVARLERAMDSLPPSLTKRGAS